MHREFCSIRHWDTPGAGSRGKDSPCAQQTPVPCRDALLLARTLPWGVILIFCHFGTAIFSIFPSVLVLKSCLCLMAQGLLPLAGGIHAKLEGTGSSRSPEFLRVGIGCLGQVGWKIKSQ